MKLFRTAFLLAFSVMMFSSVYAQHTVQVDDGAGHNSEIVASSTPTRFKLPTNTGTAGQVLTSDGAGGTSFQPAAGPGFTPSFLYIYNTNAIGPLFVLPNSPIPFFFTGTITGTAFTNGFTSVTINETGTYQIDFSVSPGGGGTIDYAVAVNGVSAAGATYTSHNNMATQGMAYLHFNAGDIVSVNNADPAFLSILGGAGYSLSTTIASLRMTRVQ